MASEQVITCDYVVVGSGAGGGTLAARLAEAGSRVVLLEAGGDPRQQDSPRLPDDYDVPAFHPFASENPAIAWNYFVNHYADVARQQQDAKYQPSGILYPRAGTLGGCTAHNAQILLYPHESDWNAIAALTGDESWRAERMLRYFQKVENCRHRPLWRALRHIGLDPTGHGWDGWLSVEHGKPQEVFKDERLIWTIIDSAHQALHGEPRFLAALRRLFLGQADPNDQRLIRDRSEGVCYLPLSTRNHARFSVRERVLDVARRHPGKLQVELDALATSVMFDEQNNATGIAYLKGERLYRADPNPTAATGQRRAVMAAQGVILAGGAFNSPQLLMLSGIGPADALRQHGIAMRVDLPGVGQNLQDRYEIGVVNRLRQPWQVLEGARFQKGDPLYQAWETRRTGMYISNGGAIAVSKRSTPARPDPDIFCMALLAKFFGYFPGYARVIADHHDYLTWAVLKAHTSNRRGSVALRSADPRDTPFVNFNYFDEGSDDGAADLAAVIAGVRFARQMAQPLNAQGLIAAEELPGSHLQSDDELAVYIRNNAWGHHASCSCAIGPREAGGVLDSNLRVHGVNRLRVVDASVFPRIPGFFIASAIYMIAEKAAESILSEQVSDTAVTASRAIGSGATP